MGQMFEITGLLCQYVLKWQKVWPWQDLNLHSTWRESNPRCPEGNRLVHYHYATGMLYQLSYMAGETPLAEKSNIDTLLQHAAERFLSRKKIEDEEKRASPNRSPQSGPERMGLWIA